jgi:hypothetical protein
MEGKELGKTISYGKKTLDELGEGNSLKVGGKELEVYFASLFCEFNELFCRIFEIVSILPSLFVFLIRD